MKVLIVAQHVNFFRNLETVIRELCRRGHEVVFLHGLDLEDPRAAKKMARKISRGKLVLTRGLADAEADIPSVTSGHRPKAPEASCRALRYGRQVMNRATYLRTGHPSPTRVVEIIEREMPPGLATRVARNPWKWILRQPFAMKAWRRLEDASPASPTLLALLSGVAPNVIVVSPGIWPKDLVEADYLHAARALGIPTLGYINSWDNLTSKGTVHVLPDQFVVWNEPMAREARDLHLVPSDMIRITGAPHLDHFFAMRPTATHADVMTAMGVPQGRVYLTYLCSSRTLVNDETSVVTRLADALAVERPEEAPIVVVRPHPTNPGPWAEYEHAGVVVYPRGGDQADSSESWQQYFNQLAHGRCAVGLNSTAFLEAAVAGRPCLTIVGDEFWDAQGRTGHFRHLLAGDFIEAASSVQDAARCIARIVDGVDEKRAQRTEFIRSFLRPCGIDRPAADVVADVIERSALPGGSTESARSAAPIPAPTPRRATRMATRALPVLHEWTSWLAADEAREKIADHAAFLRSKSGARDKGRLMCVVPDTRAIGYLRGLLNYLSRERHEVDVVMTEMSPDDPVVATLEGHWGLTVRGLTVGRVPRPATGSGRPELVEGRSGPGAMLAWLERQRPPNLDVISLLEDRKPNLLVVVPHRRSPAVEADYFKAARWLGIRSVCLPLRWDDLETSRSRLHELPDVFAVWNDAQRHNTIDSFKVPEDRVHVTGALLPSDVVEGHAVLARDAYCSRMGIDPSRQIVLIDAPGVSSPEWIAQFQEWRRSLKESANPETHDAAVVVYIENPDAVATWRRLASTDDFVVARAGVDEDRVAFRLAESLAAADVVVATGLTFALEALSRMKPTVVFAGAGGRDADDLDHFMRMCAPLCERLTIARGTAQAAAQVAIALTQETPSDALRQAAAIVRPIGEGTSTANISTLFAELSQQDYDSPAATRPPLWQRLLLLGDALARGREAAR